MSLLKKQFNLIRQLAEDGRLAGIILVIVTAASILLANSAFSAEYIAFWKTTLFGEHAAHGESGHNTIEFVINDVLMAIFFLLVGMEIKREMVSGELSNIKHSLLPVLCAVGGMAVPAAIYAVFNLNSGNLSGWAIPSATDIAFSLGVMSLLGKIVPYSLKVFLTALAVIDDLGAIIVIAFFYSSDVHWLWLLGTVGVAAVLFVLNKIKVKSPLPYLLLFPALWFCMLEAGIHATLAGVLLGMLIPVNTAPAISRVIHRPVNFFILPLFAMANTAILIEGGQGSYVTPLTLGVFFGLFAGKFIGIFSVAFITEKLGITSKPRRSTWKQVAGAAILGGIGFTMAIFVTNLSFDDIERLNMAKIAIIAASLVSAIAGFIFLYIGRRKSIRRAKKIITTHKAAS